MAEALALSESPQFPLDANGVPIKPGYRKPFTSDTARKAQLNSARARIENGLTAKLQRDSRIIFEVLNQVRIMLEKRSKRGSRVVLQKSGHGKNVVQNSPVSPSQISPTVRPISKPKPAPTPVIPQPVDDYDGLF